MEKMGYMRGFGFSRVSDWGKAMAFGEGIPYHEAGYSRSFLYVVTFVEMNDSLFSIQAHECTCP